MNLCWIARLPILAVYDILHSLCSVRKINKRLILVAGVPGLAG